MGHVGGGGDGVEQVGDNRVVAEVGGVGFRAGGADGLGQDELGRVDGADAA